jgi:hypothetical protein
VSPWRLRILYFDIVAKLDCGNPKILQAQGCPMTATNPSDAATADHAARKKLTIRPTKWWRVRLWGYIIIEDGVF